MRKMKFPFIMSVFTSLFSLSAMAEQTLERDSYFYIAPKAIFLSETDTNEEAFGYGLDAGYQWNPYFRTELGGAHLGAILANNNDDLIGVSAAAVGVLPLSDYANINLGVGPMIYKAGNQNDTIAMAKLNIEYAITKSLDLVIGYRYFYELAENDLYAFELGLKYNFGRNDSFVKPKPIVTSIPVVDPKPVIEPEPTVPLVNVLVDCEYDVVVKEYTVMKGDYLHKIATKFDMKFLELQSLNPIYFDQRNPDLIYPDEIVQLDVLQKRVEKRENCDDSYIHYKN